MVQNQVTILGWNGPNGAFRQVRPLAEHQKSADSMISQNHPLRQPRQLAEGVEFPERYADFSPFAQSFGGGGRISREKIQDMVSSSRHLVAESYGRNFEHARPAQPWTKPNPLERKH